MCTVFHVYVRINVNANLSIRTRSAMRCICKPMNQCITVIVCGISIIIILLTVLLCYVWQKFEK